jgi:hypothetical protein
VTLRMPCCASCSSSSTDCSQHHTQAGRVPSQQQTRHVQPVHVGVMGWLRTKSRGAQHRRPPSMAETPRHMHGRPSTCFTPAFAACSTSHTQHVCEGVVV